MWVQRDLEETLRKVATQRPALLLTGSRQAGKTSLLRRVFPAVRYLSLDLPATAQEAEESGGGFLERHPPPVIIDEIQYAPRLLHHVKAAIERRRQDKGLFLMTGSQKLSLMAGVSESLAGRVGVLRCLSLSAREVERSSGVPLEHRALLDAIFRGGYPELHATALDPQRFYADYVATYLERDVRQLLAVRSLRDFNRFLRLAAVRTGQILSLNSFASDLGISPTTVRSWLSVLEASDVAVLLEPYYRNLGKRIVKTPKLYFTDTGLACFLAGIRSTGDLERSELLGPVFETHVLSQILRWYANRGRTPDVYFYRDHHGHEVDFLIPRGEKLKLIECKWAESPQASTRGFAEIVRLVGGRNVISRSMVTPRRGARVVEGSGARFDDSVDLECLEL